MERDHLGKADASLAAELLQEGLRYAQMEQFSSAEAACLKALRLYCEWIEKDCNPLLIDSAREICEILADLNMQQGNMHGADHYYALAGRFSSRNLI